MRQVEINGRKYMTRTGNVTVLGSEVYIDGKLGVPVDESGLPDVECQLWFARGNTYGVRQRLAAEGGEWNEDAKRWEFREKPTFPPMGEVGFIPEPLPPDWKLVRRIGGVRKPGSVVEHDEMPSGDGVVVACFEEGNGFGKKPVQRWLLLRPRNPEEPSAMEYGG